MAILTDHLGMPIPSALPTTDNEEIRLLQTLGRLEFMTVEQIWKGFFPRLTAKAVYTRLENMLETDVVWRTKSRYMHITLPTGKGGAKTTAARKREWLKHPYVYGLTDAGKELLSTLEVERDEANLIRLRSRDPRAKRQPDPRTLGHDLQVSWWVLNVVLEAARNRLCRAIYAQVEFIPEERQRIDALVILRLSPNRPRKVEDIGPIPWFDGTRRADDEVDVRLALEVDRGTEELRVLLEKGAAYRDLTLDGYYSRLLGGPVLPVFLVQTEQPHLTIRRVRQIATEYRDIWEGGWGVASTPLAAAHAEAGALWGKYRTLAYDTSFSLLTEFRVANDGQVSLVPVCDLPTWLKYRVLPNLAATPEQLAGQAGGRARAAERRARETKVVEGFRALEEDAEDIEEAEDADAAA
jgi:hypothetical protein